MRFLFLQLPPISPDGIPARENHPLGAAHLVLEGRRAGGHDLAIVDRATADEGSDEAIVDAIEAARPDVLGVTLYVWNVVRARHIVAEARRRLPALRVIAGGPEIVPGRSLGDGIDVGVPGEGEAPFAAMLAAGFARPVPGVILPGGGFTGPASPAPSLDLLENPYLAGLVDARRDSFLYLETTRGCKFHCSFCRYDADVGGPVRSLSLPRVEEILRHAAEREVKEVFLLDPTLNQRRDTKELLRVLARGNQGGTGGRHFRYGGELVAELVDDETADLLAEAGFHTVEVGLQSTNPETLRCIQRFHHREKFLRGVRLLKERGVRVRVDLIVGLPHETLASAKAAVDFVAEHGMGEDIQVFELMVLPGTALANQAASLGIEHLGRPPYTVLRTPTMGEEDIAEAVAYSERVFDVAWTPAPRLRNFRREERVEFRGPIAHRRNYMALDARGAPFAAAELARSLSEWLARNPFASVDVLLRADGTEDLSALRRLVVAMQAADFTVGAQLHRRVWTFVDRSRASREWLDRAGALSILRPLARPTIAARRPAAG